MTQASSLSHIQRVICQEIRLTLPPKDTQNPTTSHSVHSYDCGLSPHLLLLRWPLAPCPHLVHTGYSQHSSKRILLEYIRPGHLELQTLQKLPFPQSKSQRPEHGPQDLPGPECPLQDPRPFVCPSATPALPVPKHTGTPASGPVF